MKKKIPIFRSDKDAEAFVVHQDVSNYDYGERRVLWLEQ